MPATVTYAPFHPCMHRCVPSPLGEQQPGKAVHASGQRDELQPFRGAAARKSAAPTSLVAARRDLEAGLALGGARAHNLLHVSPYNFGVVITGVVGRQPNLVEGNLRDLFLIHARAAAYPAP